jgi:hypothetical protein
MFDCISARFRRTSRAPWRRCRHLRDAAQHRKQLIPQKEVQALVDAIELEPWLSYARPRKARGGTHSCGASSCPDWPGVGGEGT